VTSEDERGVLARLGLVPGVVKLRYCLFLDPQIHMPREQDKFVAPTNTGSYSELTVELTPGQKRTNTYAEPSISLQRLRKPSQVADS
jgi:hypothetical protein